MELTAKDIERFWSMVNKNGPDGCWIWTGAVFKDSRPNVRRPGCIRIGGKSRRAYDVAWEIEHGQVPDGYEVCHTCDNPLCCNDEHLFLGTHADNMRDMIEKGRGGQQKLTIAQVQEIREKYATGEYSHGDLAKQYNVSDANIGLIVQGKTYSWLPNPAFGVKVKRRGARGESHAHSKLTTEIVVEIRRRYAEGKVSQHELADEYGIRQSTVSDIIRRRKWAWLT